MSEIAERLDELKSKNILNLKKVEYSTKYIGSASEGNGKELTKLNDFQIAFINLFEEKNAELVEQFRLILENDLKELVEPAEFEKINLDEDVGFYSLTIPKKNGNDEWNIALATSFDETIFHAYFTGWQFINLGLTIWTAYNIGFAASGVWRKELEQQIAIRLQLWADNNASNISVSSNIINSFGLTAGLT